MVREIRNEPFKKRFLNLFTRHGSVIFPLLLVPFIAVTFIVVHQKQDLREHAAGPTDFLVYPTDVDAYPSDATKNSANGFLRVTTSPLTQTEITVMNKPQEKIILQQKAGVTGTALKAGDYYVSFSKVGEKSPPTTSFTITGGKATDITADFTTGKVSVVTK